MILKLNDDSEINMPNHYIVKKINEIIDWINSQGLVDGKPLIPPTHRTNGKVNNAIPDTQSPESTFTGNGDLQDASKDTRKGCGRFLDKGHCYEDIYGIDNELHCGDNFQSKIWLCIRCKSQKVYCGHRDCPEICQKVKE